VVFNASGVFATSLTREIEPPAAIAEVGFPVFLPPATPAGALVLTAEAFDLAGNTSGVHTRALVVTDVVAPAVLITSPAANATVDPRQPVPVTVTANDAVGVTEVAFTATGAASTSVTRAIVPAATTASETFSITFNAPPAPGGTLTLSATARDAAGNVGSAPSIVVQVLDVVAPTVAATSPANGAIGIDPQTLVVVEFSEPIDAATLTTASLSLSRGAVAEPVSISVSPDGRLATLTPVTRPLPLNTIFTLTIAESVADRAGNPMGTPATTTFRTASPDITAPRVVASDPANNAVGVGLAVPIDVTFSEPVDPVSVTAASFRVSIGGSAVSGARLVLDANVRARFLATEPLPTDAVVVVELTSAIADTAGNPLVNSDGSPLTTPYTFTFVTGSFGITSPAAGVEVVENSNLLIEARASGASGVASVVFTINGQAQSAATAAPFTVAFAVPSAASTPTLTIVASARNAQGVEIATDTRTVNVVVGLRVSPSLAGVPLGANRTLRFSLSSAIPGDLSIQLSAGDPALVSFPVNPVVLPAGQTMIDAAVHGEASGNTAVFGSSTRGDTVTVVSVSPVVPGQAVTPIADPVGALFTNPPSAATVAISTNPVSVGLPGLISWWRGDGDAQDSAGANHGSLQNGATFGTGRFGQAFSFDGVDDQISVAHNASLNAGSAITIASWINVTTMGHARSIAQMRAPGNVGGYTFETAHGFGANDALQWVVWRNGAYQILQTPSGVVQPGVWHHVAATFDGSMMRIFVDGAERAALANPGPIDASNDPLVIGRNVVIPSFAWHGLLDEIQVYGRPLSAAEIQTLFQGVAGNQTARVNVAVLSAPAAVSTNVSITSTNPEVATATAGSIAAGGQVAELTIVTGQAGTATLFVRAGSDVRSVTVIVGSPAASALPVVLAPPVGVGMRNPPIVGTAIAAPGAQSTLIIGLLASPATGDTPFTVESTNPGVATAAPGLIPAGSQTANLTIAAHANGVATLILRAGDTVSAFTVIVGTPAPGTTPLSVAPPVGATVRPPPSVGGVFAPMGVSRTISIRVLDAPAAEPTPVSVSSSDGSVVTVGAPAIVPAGQQVVDLTLSTGAGGSATLMVEALGRRFAFDVVVGSDPTPRSPTIGAPLVGASVVAAPSLGRIIAPANVGSTPTIVVPLLTSAAPGPISVSVRTSNTAIVGVGPDPIVTLTIEPSAQVVSVPLSIVGTEGAALLTFEFEGQRRDLIVVVGDPPASQLPAVTSPVVGVQVVP
jgi:hypothetical protein